MREAAEAALAGVGDASLGEWREWNAAKRVYHLKRRLTPEEQQRVGPALDIRHTDEAAQRLAATRAALPLNLRYLIRDDLVNP